MTITEAAQAVYLRGTGKSTAPPTAKYNQIIGLLDFYQRRWAREPGIDWVSLYNPSFSLGPVTNTDTYDVDTSSVRKLSNFEGDVIRIMWTDGQGYSDYDVVPADTLKEYFYGQNKENPIGKVCAQIGTTLVFNHIFTTNDPEFGGDIQIPIYAFPDAIDNSNPDSDEIQVDDPDWLVVRCAAEFVRNDITRQQHYPELVAESNEIMGRMKDDNDFQIDVVDTPWSPFSGLTGDGGWY